MYLRECLIENIGPIEFFDVLPFDERNNPNPWCWSGRMAWQKHLPVPTSLMPMEFKQAYEDVVRAI